MIAKVRRRAASLAGVLVILADYQRLDDLTRPALLSACEANNITKKWGQNMITVRDAVKAATDYLKDFGSLLPSQTGLRLEETELWEEPPLWIITISFQASPFDDNSRVYKQFRVNADNGEVQSMKSVLGI